MLINAIGFACLITDYRDREDDQPITSFWLHFGLFLTLHYSLEKMDYSEQKFGENYFHSKIASKFHNYLK